jgi:hypothetical protein
MVAPEVELVMPIQVGVTERDLIPRRVAVHSPEDVPRVAELPAAAIGEEDRLLKAEAGQRPRQMVQDVQHATARGISGQIG